MIANIECPVCHSSLDLDLGVTIKPEAYKNKYGIVEERNRITHIDIRHVEPVDAKITRIMEQIDPHIKPGIEISQLADTLQNEFKVCRVHVPMMIDRIKDAYQLYSPDGKTLEIIK